MKNLLISILIFTTLNNFCLSQSEWDNTSLGGNTPISDISFINPNTGYAILSPAGSLVSLYRTTNKGINWSLAHHEVITEDKSKNASIYFKSYGYGFISCDNRILKYESDTISTVFTFPNFSLWHKIIFVSDQIGYAVFNNLNDVAPNNYLSYSSIYKTTNGGNNWFVTSVNSILSQNGTNRYACLRDIDFSKNDINELHAVGYYVNGTGSQGISTDVYTTNAFSSNTISGDAVSGSKFWHVNILDNEVRILGNKGLKINITGENTYTVRNIFFNPSVNNSELGMNFINSSTGFVALHNGKLMKTTNSGNNWADEINIESASGEFQSGRLINFDEIVYYGSGSSQKFYAKKLFSNFLTYFDDQSSSSSFIVDGTSHNTPTTDHIRGGYLSLSTGEILDSSQSSEKIFYKWNNNSMSKSLTNYYYTLSGTISNYYKTKQLSTTSAAISNVGQVKALKDSLGNIHQIHQSLDGGIFYTKSYNNGSSYKREEVVNYSSTAAFGNKNPALCETKWYGGLSSGYPVNKNISACWERFNSSSGMTEIKAAVRNYEIDADTIFKWLSWEDESNSDVFASFSSGSNYNSFPKIFASALEPGTYLGTPSKYFFVIPHLRPHQGGNKLVVSCRKGSSLAADFALDSGDISDLAVVDSVKNPGHGTIMIHFAYRKGNQILYRKELFMYQTSYPNNEMIGTYHLEGPKDVTTGDGGFPSRSTPDISLMGGVPVITYSASYNAWRTIEYEDQSTGSIQVNRHPIVKVQRVTSNNWTNFVIYNSGNIQSKPDIEGSTSTLSYILNYSMGNGSFKKVANISGYPGTICQPNIFSGTDSRLVNSSFTGSFGSNMSLLTLSPQSGLYKLDKQNFILTNITAENFYDVDNLDGVVDLDTISYSFKVGPIYTQSFYENYYEINGVGVTGPSYEEPVIGGIEFNENLKSYPFLLNETQALLIGSNATYVKDNNYYSISEIPYTVNLYNKTTGLLHRTLFQDTIRSQDSVEVESLRGYYITDIPNGVDSFYVKLEVDDEFENADYYINPIYEDDEYGPTEDNISEGKIAIIYENTVLPSVNNNIIIPTDYSLSQNYPNPFNPTTKITFALPEDGLTKISVYDISGKEIEILVNETRQAGTYNIVFNGINFASGVYFYRIQSNDFIQTKQMMLIK